LAESNGIFSQTGMERILILPLPLKEEINGLRISIHIPYFSILALQGSWLILRENGVPWSKRG
jgi:hypothetical protein